MNNELRIVFFGGGSYVVPILEVLNKNFNVPLVLTTENLASQGQALQTPIINFCRENGVEYVSVKKFDEDVKGQLSKVNCQAAVLANFGLIIPKSVLDLFPKGIINVHPSLLPKYRGPTPGQSTILSGDEKTGVTIIKLDKEVDHGPILAQVEETIKPSDTSQTLYERLFMIGAQMLPEVINKYLTDELKPKEQDHSKATFTERLDRNSGYINLNGQLSIVNGQLSRMVRAYFPWPGVWTRAIINNKQSIIKFLPQERVQVEGRRPMSYKDFLNGYFEGKQILEKLNLT